MSERVSNRIHDWDDPSFEQRHIPQFIKKYKLNQGSTNKSYDDVEELKFWRRRDILIPGQEIPIDPAIYTVNLLNLNDDFTKMNKSSTNTSTSNEPLENDELKEIVDFWNVKDYKDHKETNDLMDNCFNSAESKKEIYKNENDRCIYIASMLNYSFECRELMYSGDDLGFESIENEYPVEYRNSERVLIKSKKLADLLWNRIK